MKYLKMVGNVVLYFGSLILANILSIILTRFLITSKIISGNSLEWLRNNQGVLSLVTVLFAMCFYLIIFKLKKKSLKEFCEIKPISSRNVIMLFGIGLSMSIFTTALTSTAYVLEKLPDIDKTVNFFMGSGNVIAAFLSAVLIMPAFEEIVFRGLIFNEFKNNIALPIAFILSNLLYALVQPSLATMVFGFIGGILFTLSFIWIKSLWAPIILQTGSCFFMMLFRRLGVYLVFRELSSIVIAVLVLAAAIAIAYLMLSFRKDFKNNAKETKNLSI